VPWFAVLSLPDVTMTHSPPSYAADQDAWWVQRWVDLLNSYRFKKRLERGRIYAREGNILSIEYKGAKVKALVQGTADEPYHLTIWLDAFSNEDWSYVVEALAEKAIYSAQLLAGEMPDDIEAVFTRSGLSLFPFNLSEVHSKCSCPDPKNPCKHIAAVYYQLGDFFREDPFVLFRLRGRTRKAILEALRQKRQRETPAPDATTADAPSPTPSPGPNLRAFWRYDEPLDSSLVVITPRGTPVLDVLGPLPVPTEDAPIVMEQLKTIYQGAAQQAMIAALGRE